jgi:hypothetical protein
MVVIGCFFSIANVEWPMPRSQQSPKEWAKLTMLGLDALAEGRLQDAASLWRWAARMTKHAALSEPRRAAAQNNAGVAYLLSARTEEAMRAFGRARRHWGRAGLHLTPQRFVPAPSTACDLPKTMEHDKASARLRQRRCVFLCKAAHRITMLNRCLAMGQVTSKAHIDTLSAEITDAFGPHCAEVKILAEMHGDGATPGGLKLSPYQEKMGRVLHLHDFGGSPSQESEINVAASLTVLMHPSLHRVLAGHSRRPSVALKR